MNLLGADLLLVPLGHLEATERALLVGPERTEALAGTGDGEQLADHFRMDLGLVVFDLAVELPLRELRARDADGGRGLGLIADPLALVDDPREVAIGVRLAVVQWQRDVVELQQFEQGRGLGRRDLLLAVLDLLAGEDERSHQHFGGQSDPTVVVAVDLGPSLLDSRTILDLRETNSLVEALERLTTHFVHHQGRNTHTVNPNLLHGRTPLFCCALRQPY